MTTRSDQEATAINPTAFFEGGYPTGNFDGMGLSCGTIQFNLGQGTLQPVIKMMYANGEQTFTKICGAALTAEILHICNAPIAEAIAWGDKYSVGSSKQHVMEPLYTALVTLWKNPVFQAIDRHFCAAYLLKAREWTAFYNVETVRGLSFFFDVAVQDGCGRLGPNAISSVMQDFANRGGFALEPGLKLAALAHVVADTARTQYQDLVLSRKLAIAKGSGVVYGDVIDVDGKFGISDEVLVA